MSRPGAVTDAASGRNRRHGIFARSRISVGQVFALSSKPVGDSRDRNLARRRDGLSATTVRV